MTDDFFFFKYLGRVVDVSIVFLGANNICSDCWSYISYNKFNLLDTVRSVAVSALHSKSSMTIC